MKLARKKCWLKLCRFSHLLPTEHQKSLDPTSQEKTLLPQENVFHRAWLFQLSPCFMQGLYLPLSFRLIFFLSVLMHRSSVLGSPVSPTTECFFNVFFIVASSCRVSPTDSSTSGDCTAALIYHFFLFTSPLLSLSSVKFPEAPHLSASGPRVSKGSTSRDRRRCFFFSRSLSPSFIGASLKRFQSAERSRAKRVHLHLWIPSDRKARTSQAYCNGFSGAEEIRRSLRKS